MKMKFILVLLLSPAIVLMISSCKKDLPAQQNHRPVANAGTDITIILPTDSAELSASVSGMDGNGISLEWVKISGPSSGTIVNPNSRITKLKNLVEGVYEFKLTVDDDGLWLGRDTVVVFVVLKTAIQGINCQMTSIGMLSKPRGYVAVASAGNKILFAGGLADVFFSRVDIYDISSQSWSVAELSEGRTFSGAATVGNKVLFAGGATSFDDSFIWGWRNSTSRVDIYDVSTNTWTTSELPEARNFEYVRDGAVIANKVFFAGRLGSFFETEDVQVYDVQANSWSSFALSQPRGMPVIVSVGDKILIAGGENLWGFSKSVEIYDASGNLLSVDSLSVARAQIKAATLNNKAFFAGGFAGGGSNRVDIYDGTTQTWSIASLSRANGLAAAVSAGQRILFFGDERVDIYDESTDTWSTADLPVSFSWYQSTIIAAGGNIYAVNREQVWLVEF